MTSVMGYEFQGQGHQALCANVVKVRFQPHSSRVPSPTRPACSGWANTHGSSLRSERTTVSALGVDAENLVCKDVLWFKARIDPQTPLSAAPAASGAR